MPHTILIIGSDDEGSLESSYARAFKHFRWAVYFWNPVVALHTVARGRKIGRFLSTYIHVEPWIRKANVELLQLADEMQPNLILVIGTEGVRAGTLAQLKVRRPHCPIYCIYPDSPHNLDNDSVSI